MSSSRKPNTRLAVESLEPRWLMAGNVTALAVPMGGDAVNSVVIVGDNQANQIRVIEDAPEHIRIEGLEGTTVNGKAADELFAVGDVFVRVDIDLGNGNDTLIHDFGGDQFRHATTVDTGHGNDLVSVIARGVLGTLRIDTGTGNDNVTLNLAPASFLSGGLRVDTGAGDDDVLFRANSDGGLPELDFSFIETKGGNDLVRFEGTFGAWGGLSIGLGAGDDTLVGGTGEDRPLGNVFANGGLGHDTVLNTSYFDLWNLVLFETMDEDE
jgi:hypothetical protein